MALKFADWLEIETAAYAGRPLLSNDKSVSVFAARSLRHAYREAEAHALLHDSVDSLQAIRTQISRGKTGEARSMIETSLSMQSLTFLEASEFHFELARIHLLEADWQACIDRLTELLDGPVSQVTKLTALQCRAVSFYELGLRAQALRDIDQVLSLATLFPKAPGGFYANVLQAKIRELDGATASADRLVTTLWDKIIAEPNLDRVLTMCRLEADFARMRGLNPRRWALAAHAVATEMGDDLYAALARLELWAAGDRSRELEISCLNDLISFPRVALQTRQLETDASRSTTTALLAKSAASSAVSSVSDARSTFENRPLVIEALILPSRQLVVRLQPLEIVHDPKSKKMFQALELLASNEKVSKADLFRALHGASKYVPHLHDATLHQLLSRMRKRLGVTITIADGFVQAPSVWLVGES